VSVDTRIVRDGATRCLLVQALSESEAHLLRCSTVAVDALHPSPNLSGIGGVWLIRYISGDFACLLMLAWVVCRSAILK
jgi:hypothetical protein